MLAASSWLWQMAGSTGHGICLAAMAYCRFLDDFLFECADGLRRVVSEASHWRWLIKKVQIRSEPSQGDVWEGGSVYDVFSRRQSVLWVIVQERRC
jgi:hypothetical protein